MPSVIARKVAFQPPSRPLYSFVCADGQGGELKANASSALGRRVLRVELEESGQSAERGEDVVENCSAFVVQTGLGNHLACVHVRCPLVNVPPSQRNKVRGRSTVAGDTPLQVVLFCQPNSSDLGMFLWRRRVSSISLKKIADRLAVDVFAFDYSGFGISSGTPSERTLYDDIRAVYSFIRRSLPQARVFLMGLSLGTAACVDLAATNPEGLAGVVLLAPFTSGVRVLMGKAYRRRPYKMDAFRRWARPRPNPRTPARFSVEKIGAVRVPVFVAHGLLDDVIAYDHGVALLRRCRFPAPIALPAHADHSNLFTFAVARKILAFVAREADDYARFHCREAVLAQLEQQLSRIRRGDGALDPASTEASSCSLELGPDGDTSALEEEIDK